MIYQYFSFYKSQYSSYFIVFFLPKNWDTLPSDELYKITRELLNKYVIYFKLTWQNKKLYYLRVSTYNPTWKIYFFFGSIKLTFHLKYKPIFGAK